MNAPFAFLAAHSARFDDTASSLDFGDPDAEVAAAADATVAVPLAHLGLIRATGEDSAGFLHNLFTNDVKQLAEDAAQFNGFCTAKGRLLASFLIWREGPDYLLQLPRTLLPAILKKLSMYVLRAKVKLTDASDERLCIGVAGPQAEQALAAAGLTAPQQPMASTGVDGGRAIRLNDGRIMLALQPAAAEAAWRALVGLARPAGSATWRWLDIRAGVPLVQAATQEEFVPQMANFDLIGAVNFQKGCYPGQEIVARTQYLGKLKRRMYRARVATAEVPAPGTAVYAPETREQACGNVVDAVPAGNGAVDLLAVVQISCHDAGVVTLGSPAGPRLTFTDLPYAVS